MKAKPALPERVRSMEGLGGTLRSRDQCGAGRWAKVCPQTKNSESRPKQESCYAKPTTLPSLGRGKEGADKMKHEGCIANLPGPTLEIECQNAESHIKSKGIYAYQHAQKLAIATSFVETPRKREVA